MISHVSFFSFVLFSYLLLYFNITQKWLSMGETFGIFHIIILLVSLTALILTLVFHRSRLFFSLILLLGMSFLIEYFDMMRHTAEAVIYIHTFGRQSDFFIETFLPWIFIGLGFFKDRGITTQHGWGLILLIVMTLLLYFSTISFQLDWIKTLQNFSISSLPIDWISHTTLLSWVFLAIITLIMRLRSYHNESIYFIISLGVVLVALLPRTVDNFILALFFISLIMIFYIINHSYYMAYIDELTQLKGRRAMNEYLLRVGSEYTIVIGDIDHFKKFNDTYGHDVGDEVLKLVARELSKIGGGAEVFRWGGEEFALIFKGKDALHAFTYTDQVRKNIQAQSFILRAKNRPPKKPKEPKALEKKEVIHVTMSFGIAQRDASQEYPQEVLKAADKQLYNAKEAGRNCVKGHL